MAVRSRTTDTEVIAPPVSATALEISAPALLLGILPLAVLSIGDQLFAQLGWSGKIHLPALPAKIASNAPQLQAIGHWDGAGRLYLLAALIAAGAAAAFVSAMFIADLARRFAPQSRRRLIVAAAIGLAGIPLIIAAHTLDRAQDYLGTGFMAEATCRLSAAENLTKGLPAGECGRLLATFNGIVIASAVMLWIGATAAILGGVSCLARSGSEDARTQRAEVLAQLKRLRGYVNLSGVLMVSTLLFLWTWTHWPETLVVAPADKAFAAHAAALVLYYGLIYSLVILAFSAPVSAILRERLGQLPAPAQSPKKPSAPEDTTAIDSTFWKSLVKLLPALAPTVVGALPSLIDVVAR